MGCGDDLRLFKTYRQIILTFECAHGYEQDIGLVPGAAACGSAEFQADILALKEMGLHGAIIGKAYYTGAIDLKKALEAVR